MGLILMRAGHSTRETGGALRRMKSTYRCAMASAVKSALIVCNAARTSAPA